MSEKLIDCNQLEYDSCIVIVRSDNAIVIAVDTIVPADTTNKLHIALDISKLKGYYLSADGSLKIQTANDEIDLIAHVPLYLDNTGTGVFKSQLTSDVTSMLLTTIGGTTRNLKMIFILDGVKSS